MLLTHIKLLQKTEGRKEVWLSLFFEISGNIVIVIVCFPVCDENVGLYKTVCHNSSFCNFKQKINLAYIYFLYTKIKKLKVIIRISTLGCFFLVGLLLVKTDLMPLTFILGQLDNNLLNCFHVNVSLSNTSISGNEFTPYFVIESTICWALLISLILWIISVSALIPIRKRLLVTYC